MKKKNILKPFGFSALALLMATVGIFAFVPLLNTNAQEQPTTISGLGLDPKNDPVIYTTESGLEIKFGGINVNQSYPGTVASGLTGYPYITMGTYGGEAVNWIIIGRATDVIEGKYQFGMEARLFSTWYENANLIWRNYFDANIYETESPAGSLVYNTTFSKTWVMDDGFVSFDISNIVSNAEIPSGCVLVWSEKVLGTCKFHTSNIKTYEGSTLQSYCNTLWSSTLQLSDEEKNIRIKPQILKSWTYLGGGYSESHLYTTTGSQAEYMFPMGHSNKVSEYSGVANFSTCTYLGNSEYHVDDSAAVCARRASNANYWVRGTGSYSYNTVYYWIRADGVYGSNHSTSATTTSGVRPACVISLA